MEEPAVEPLPPSRPGSVKGPALMLVLITALWGLSFPLMKDWHEAAADCPGGEIVASSTLIALRMIGAILLLLLLRPRLTLDATRKEHLIGAAVGSAFCLGFFLQVLGLAHTTPAHSGFFTSLNGAWVPPLGWLLFRLRTSPITIAGIGVAVLGAMILLLRPSDQGINHGDLLTIAASLLFTLQVLLLDRLGRNVTSSHLTFALFATTAVPMLLAAMGGAMFHAGLADWFVWIGKVLSQPGTLIRFVVLTALCTALAFHWMNTYQPQLPAARAGLIYFMEPVFATLFSVLMGHDEVTDRLLVGGILILLGNLLVELPVWRRQK